MSAASATSTWSMKGLGQALSWLKEKKESMPLNAYLTYITLPWTSVLEGKLLILCPDDIGFRYDR